MVVPISDNPLEYTLITPILYSASSTPLSYVIEGESRTIRNPDGTKSVLKKGDTWEPLPAEPGDPDTVTVVSSVIVSGTKTYTTEISCSNRTLQPYRWKSSCFDSAIAGYLYNTYWLRYGGGDPANSQTGTGPPVGGATDINERWWERFTVTGTDPNTMAFHHNPTMGGAGDRPTIGTDIAVSAKMYTGRPYHYKVKSRTSSSDPALIEGGNSPIDFGGDPGNYEYSDHGNGAGNDAEDQLAWWWRMRMWRRFLPNYKEMARITRVDNASYFPVDWDNDGVSYYAPSGNLGRVVLYFVENWDLVPSSSPTDGFDQCYAINVSAQEFREVSNIFPTGGILSNAAGGYIGTRNISRHRSLAEFSETSGVNGHPASGLHVVAGTVNDSFYDTPYLGLAFVNSNTGFCFAIASKIERCTDLDEELRPDLANACSLQARNRIYLNSTPLLEYSNEGPLAYVIHKSRTRRGKGWISHRTFVYTGENTNVIPDFYSLWQSGEFDTSVTLADTPAGIVDSFKDERWGFTTLNEALRVKSRSKLLRDKITLGSISDIRITTDFVVENRTLPESVKNLIKGNIVTNCSIEIVKVNDSSNLPANVTVSSFSDTSASITIPQDNLIQFKWDTNKLLTHPQVLAGNFDSIKGTYYVRAKYTLFDEQITTSPMYLTLT
jgi:hypothetical protein